MMQKELEKYRGEQKRLKKENLKLKNDIHSIKFEL